MDITLQPKHHIEQIKIFSDIRLNGMCAYCGALTDSPTRDHIPSKILLDEPFPDNLPVTLACQDCNMNFSLDEEYLACLIECTLHGTTNPSKLMRSKIKTILSKKLTLKSRLEKAMFTVGNNIAFKPEVRRIKNVIIKLAQGHVRFENSEPQIEPPNHVGFCALITMSKKEKETFLKDNKFAFLPEVGSRAFQRIWLNKKVIPFSGWIVVQPNNYAYSVSNDEHGLRVRILIREYLACEVIWNT